MEVHLTRDEIVRTVRSLLGVQTDSGLSAAVGDQHVSAVQAAALKVAQDCRWVNTNRRTTVTLQIEQAEVNYPATAGPGSIIAMAVWLDNRYVPLEPRILPVQTDTDQELAEGGDTLASVLGMPRYYEQRNQIVLYPRSDAEYPLRIEYVAAMNLPNASDTSLVDAQLIVYWAASMVARQMENDEGAKYYVALYDDRLGDLRAWQSAATRFAIDSDADLGEDEMSQAQIPNWDKSPTVP